MNSLQTISDVDEESNLALASRVRFPPYSAHAQCPCTGPMEVFELWKGPVIQDKAS